MFDLNVGESIQVIKLKVGFFLLFRGKVFFLELTEQFEILTWLIPAFFVLFGGGRFASTFVFTTGIFLFVYLGRCFWV